MPFAKIQNKIENFLFSPTILQIIRKFVIASQNNLIIIAIFNIVEIVAIVILSPINYLKSLFFPVGRSPRRIDSPLKKFQKKITTGQACLYDNAIVYLVSSSGYNKNKKVKKFYNIDFLLDSTPQTLEALTPDYIDNCRMLVRNIYDYGFANLPLAEMRREARKNNQKIIVILAGLNLFNYFRALNIALQIKSNFINNNLGKKIDIIFGGFQIRGDKQSHHEINNLGFSVADGEAENGFYSKMLIDSVYNRLALKYQTDLKPSLASTPLPYIKKKQYTYIQFARGCPMGCNFCSVCEIDGKQIRSRALPEVIVFLEHLVKQKIKNIFISDDNFCRNPLALQILDAFIDIKKKHKIEFNINIWCDLSLYNNQAANDIFMDKCRDAGVKEIRVGIESFELATLKKMLKVPNLFDDEKKLLQSIDQFISSWHQRHIGISGLFIIGNELDRVGVGAKIAQLSLKLGIDTIVPQAYILLPGSNEYKNYLSGKIDIANFDINHFEINSFNTFVNFKDPKSLTPQQVTQEIKDCFCIFYNPQNIKKVKTNIYAKGTFALTMIQSLQNRWKGDLGMWQINFTEKFNENEFEKNKKICTEYSQKT